MLGAFVWMDLNRRYFIFTGGYMEKGRPYTRMRFKQEKTEPNEYTNMVELTISQKIIADLYYSTCGQIDRKNKCRQESIDIEKIWVLNICQSGSIYLYL